MVVGVWHDPTTWLVSGCGKTSSVPGCDQMDIISLVSERGLSMRTVQVGIVALVFSTVVQETEAQQYSRAGQATGTYVSRLTTPRPIVSQAGISGELIDQGMVVGRVSTTTPGMTTISTQGQVLPYSYWVSAPQPARIYVKYGAADQFPFQGRAYGSPNDRWSWYYMGGGDSRYLAKYYYPPLR